MTDLKDRVTDLQRYVRRIPDPSMSNYKMVLASWKRVIQDVLSILQDMVDGKPPAS